MDAADLRVFDAVARTGSMSRAAQALNTVQSNVTARIRALETEVGATLFERTSRGVTLTAAGHRLLPFAARVALVLDDARRAVADDGTPTGTLVIGSLETTAALRLSPVLGVRGDLSGGRLRRCAPASPASHRAGAGPQVDGAFVCGPVNHPDLKETFVREEPAILTAPGCRLG
jgi:DNA-binding transcriptional LysR family regulator